MGPDSITATVSCGGVGRLVYFAEDQDFVVQIVVDGVVGCGHDQGFFGAVVEDELVGELAWLVEALAAPVGVHVGDLPDPYGLLAQRSLLSRCASLTTSCPSRSGASRPQRVSPGTEKRLRTSSRRKRSFDTLSKPISRPPRSPGRGSTKHGLLVALLNLVVLLVLAIVGAVVGTSLIDQLGGITLPGPVQSAAQSATQAVSQPQNLGTILSISGILALLAPFVGGALGGLWGAKTGRDRP
jgi:hypothetical protein